MEIDSTNNKENVKHISHFHAKPSTTGVILLVALSALVLIALLAFTHALPPVGVLIGALFLFAAVVPLIVLILLAERSKAMREKSEKVKRLIEQHHHQLISLVETFKGKTTQKHDYRLEKIGLEMSSLIDYSSK